MRLMLMHETGKNMAEKRDDTPALMQRFREQALKNEGPLAGFSEEELEELMMSYEKFRPAGWDK